MIDVAQPSASTLGAAIPIVVDLDGTLVHTDMLHETALRVLRDDFLSVFKIPFWLARGKAFMKQRLSAVASVDVSHLPYNVALMDWLAVQREGGRQVVLCTASDRAVADAIASHLGLFDRVIASDGGDNLAGPAKAAALNRIYGERGYDYAGNEVKDLAVWASARRAIIVNAAQALVAQARDRCEVEREFPPAPRTWGTWRRVLRVHQWMKNALLFVPFLAAHRLTEPAVWLPMILAFASFSLCASSVYVANDLLDLDSDRQHPRKRARPFASGAVAVRSGVVLAPVLLVASLALALRVGGSFLPWLIAYFTLTCAYSWTLKRLMVVDCITLAMLYTLRIVAGAAAIDMALSFWLLAFGVFLFLSLAFVKRYAELEVQILGGKQKIHGRGYYTSDAPLIQSLGVTSGYASIVVLALYLNSEAVLQLYRTPEVMWGTVPILLFWVSWMWMRAHRGEMHDDPLVFAVKDRASLCAGVLFAAVLIVGAVGWPW